MKKTIFLVGLIIFATPFLTACEKAGFVTSTGELGKRTQVYEKYIPNQSKEYKKSTSSVIYLGRDFDSNNFGPPAIKFVFD